MSRDGEVPKVSCGGDTVDGRPGSICCCDCRNLYLISGSGSNAFLRRRPPRISATKVLAAVAGSELDVRGGVIATRRAIGEVGEDRGGGDRGGGDRGGEVRGAGGPSVPASVVLEDGWERASHSGVVFVGVEGCCPDDEGGCHSGIGICDWFLEKFGEENPAGGLYKSW
jgi:hypothetical protein